MAKHTLVFIHGMGEQTAGWHMPALQVMSYAFGTYDLLEGKNFLDFVEPVPVLHADFFTQLRQMWKADVSQIKTLPSMKVQ
jgi:hypothetical protein